MKPVRRYEVFVEWRGKKWDDTLFGMNWKWELLDLEATGYLHERRVEDGYARSRKRAVQKAGRAARRHQRRLQSDHPSQEGELRVYLNAEGREVG